MAGGFEELLEELFAPLGGVTIRPMFGGRGVFREGMMFALFADDILYFKADAETVPDFEKEGFGPWSYRSHRGEDRVMPYWRAPDRLLDEPEAFAEWARAAFGVAERSRLTTKPRRAAGKAAPKPTAKPAKSTRPAKPAKPKPKAAKRPAGKRKAR